MTTKKQLISYKPIGSLHFGRTLRPILIVPAIDQSPLDPDIYFMKQIYTNKNGVVFYTELHEICISNGKFVGRYITSKKGTRNYRYWLDWFNINCINKHMTKRFGYKNRNIKLLIVPRSEIEHELFLEGI